jgi:hypothetical protein
MDDMLSEPEPSLDQLQPGSDPIARRIEERLRRHLDAPAVGPVRDALVRGQVVRVAGTRAPTVVAFKRGVLFIAGLEYVISDD